MARDRVFFAFSPYVATVTLTSLSLSERAIGMTIRGSLPKIKVGLVMHHPKAGFVIVSPNSRCPGLSSYRSAISPAGVQPRKACGWRHLRTLLPRNFGTDLSLVIFERQDGRGFRLYDGSRKRLETCATLSLMRNPRA